MPWIESHQKLEKHPKVLLLCKKTGWSLDEAIGKLHRLWWWVLDYAEDGDLSRYDHTQFLGNICGDLQTKQLLKILKEVTFIDKDGKIHHWFDYAGRYLTAKYRTSNPERLKDIQKKYSADCRRTKDRPESDNLPTLDNLPNLTLPLPVKDADKILDTLSILKNEETATWLMELVSKFPGRDYVFEAKKMITWWKEKGKQLKRPQVAFMNWMQNTQGGKNGKSNQRNSNKDGEQGNKYAPFAKQV